MEIFITLFSYSVSINIFQSFFLTNPSIYQYLSTSLADRVMANIRGKKKQVGGSSRLPLSDITNTSNNNQQSTHIGYPHGVVPTPDSHVVDDRSRQLVLRNSGSQLSTVNNESESSFQQRVQSQLSSEVPPSVAYQLALFDRSRRSLDDAHKLETYIIKFLIAQQARRDRKIMLCNERSGNTDHADNMWTESDPYRDWRSKLTRRKNMIKIRQRRARHLVGGSTSSSTSTQFTELTNETLTRVLDDIREATSINPSTPVNLSSSKRFNESSHSPTIIEGLSRDLFGAASADVIQSCTDWQGYDDIGDPDYQCQRCSSQMWYGERDRKARRPLVPTFSLCCRDGVVQLPYLTQPPQLLKHLLEGLHPKSKHFSDNIRSYNSMHAFTSSGGIVDHTVNQGRGPYTYRIGGQNSHRIGSLMPVGNQPPKFCQLYIYDTEDEINNRKRAIRGKSQTADRFDDSLLADLKHMIDEYNPLFKSFRMARDSILNSVDRCEVRLKLVSGRNTDGRIYNLPNVSEVAAVIVGDIEDTVEGRDIVIEQSNGRLQRISELHPSYLALQYPLFFPRGEDGYRLGISHCQDVVTSSDNPETVRNKLTLREWFAFHLQDRPIDVEADTLLRGRRLLQQLIVDGYTMIEAQRLTFLRFNQPKLRSENYKRLANAAADGQTDASRVGVKYFIPSSFVGGKGYVRENYQDTMTICRWCGYPDLFITFTCNPKWPEIDRFVKSRRLNAEDRPDIVARVFKQKLEALMKDFKENHIFGRTRAVVYTIEFQKRGLPHAHILLFLEREDKFPEDCDVDGIISAEIPDPIRYPLLHKAVKDLMIHGPCGHANPKSPCMVGGVCTKRFPKAFSDRTTVDGDGYPVYRRRNNGITVDKGGVGVHNGFVVPYNAELLQRYRAHINVEWCNQARSIKYLFKYINKGYDRVTVGTATRKNPEEIDHIQEYLDCRYISPPEAAWRIFSFDIHYRTPPVLRLEYHLPNEQNVVYNDDDPIEDIVARSNGARTKFTAWLEYNANNEDSRGLTYAEFPTKYVWHAKEKSWAPRKQGFTLGRMFHMSPNGGERYYMRTLLNFVKGPTCYADIRTVNGVVHDTYKDACYALGLLGDDKEYIEAIDEASYWGTGSFLRNLFATLLYSGSLIKPGYVWEKTWHHLCDDILARRRRQLLNFGLQMTDGELQSYALSEIELLLQGNGSSLSKFPDMPIPDDNLNSMHLNRLIADELTYNREQLRLDHDRYMSTITAEQRAVYDEIITAVSGSSGGFFFVYGYGGTSKTFIWNALCAALRSKGDIVLPVASSGIAAILLPRGRTAHSRFSIPINVDEKSICPGIRPGSDLAELIIKAKLIIWDEAPMLSRYCFEALDKSLRDIMRCVNPINTDKPFGGKVVVLGGDFRQILPVVPKGSREDIVHTAVCSSPIWRDIKVLRLTTNMRLQVGSADFHSEEIRLFSEWLLSIGDGLAGGPNDGVVNIELPPDVVIQAGDDPIASIVESTYPNLLNHYKDPDWLQNRSVLAPTNDVVEKVNEYVLSLLPEKEVVYLSSDEISNDENSPHVLEIYSSEFLNSISCSGLPSHQLVLKVGAIVMLLRNLDQANGLCNGTRLLISKLGDRILEATIITGSRKGEQVYIPRIKMSPSDETKFPIRFDRRQFPISVCFAMTINKSQGQSLSSVGLFLPKPVFTHGQLYVALSRVTRKSGLKVLIVDEDHYTSYTTTNVVYQEIFSNVR